MFFLSPHDSSESFNIILSVNLDKSDGRNSIPTRILKLLNKDISDQVAILFSHSFSSEIFSSISKNSKLMQIYKKWQDQSVQTIDQFMHSLRDRPQILLLILNEFKQIN